MTMAEQFIQSRRKDYADVAEFMDIINRIDPKSSLQRKILETGRAVVEIQFSDGSSEIML